MSLNLETRDTPEVVSKKLKNMIPSLSEVVLEGILKEKIDGEAFFELEDEYLQFIAPCLGDRLKLKKVIRTLGKAKVTQSHVNSEETLMSGSDGCLDLSQLDTCSYLSDDLNDSSQSQLEMDVDSQGCFVFPKQETNEHMDESTSSVDVKVEAAALASEATPPDWAENLLQIPTRFSAHTAKCITSGVLTSKAKDEIINALSTLILLYTVRPKPNDYQAVAAKLIRVHPTLKDTSDTGFYMWKKKLSNKFKNLRRDDRSKKAGIVVPPLKKVKMEKSSEGDSASASSSLADENGSMSDMAEYEVNVAYLQKSYKSGKWTAQGMALLLDLTRDRREKWILSENPSVREILQVFPCWMEQKVLIKELCSLVGTEEDCLFARWKEIEKKLIALASTESKRGVKMVYEEYKAIGETTATADCTTAYALKILTLLLHSRGKETKSLLLFFEGEVLNIEELLESLSEMAPIMCSFGVTLMDQSVIKVVVEKENCLQMSSVTAAVFCCFCCYWIFNISYPPHLEHVLLFLEQYVFRLKSSKKRSLTLQSLMDNLEKI